MKTIHSILFAGLIMVAFTGCSEGQNTAGCLYDTSSQAKLPDDINTPNDLSEREINSLQWMREEEMLAHDVYALFSGLYSVPIFRNISKSEMVHTTAVAGLLEKYGLDDPAAEHEPGRFTHQEIQSLYNQLVEQGSRSYEEAIRVGLMIEDLDIADLEKAIAEEVRNEDIVFVYSNLLRGSQNHMKAFWFHASRNSIEWEPEHISKHRFNEIAGIEDP
jgi:hypothetical protein